MNKQSETKPSVYLIDKVKSVKYQTDLMRSYIRRFFKDVEDGQPVHISRINRIIVTADLIKAAANNLKEQTEIELGEMTVLTRSRGEAE